MTTQATKRGTSTAFDLLGLFTAGRATITVSGRPFLRLDSESKSVELEADGAKEAGLRLSSVVRMEGDRVGESKLQGSAHIASALSREGWKLTLYVEGHKVLTMGAGVSKLTGRISVNPLSLKKLFDALQ
jgi:hypothetical protein